MRRTRRVVSVVAGAAAWWLVSCRDVPAPEGGVLSLSPVRLPSPGLVAGDTMRDSTGVVAPLNVVAYGVGGDTIKNTTPTFVTLDTGAHLSGARLIGDNAGTTVRVVGSVAAVQTQPVSVKVTTSPDTMLAADSTLHRKDYSLNTGDTVVNTPDLTTTVLHKGTTISGVEAVIVRYSIDRAPPGDPTKGPTLLLMNGSTQSSRDTTDASGKAARTARLRITATTGLTSDTAVVRATSSYRGRTLGTVTFVLIFNRK
jgi:hypothetical protein